MVDAPAASLASPRLTDEQLQSLSRYGKEIKLPQGQVLFTEGKPAGYLYVLLDGEVKVTTRVGDEDAVLAVHRSGEFTGEISLLTGGNSSGTGQATLPSRLRRISATDLKAVIATSSPVAGTILSAMALRVPETDAVRQQHEKLTALGTLAAGLAHELNNPASAVSRAAGQLNSLLVVLRDRSLELHRQVLPPDRFEEISALMHELWDGYERHCELDPLVRSDREEALCTWLEQHGVGEGWTLASALVSAGIDCDWLERLKRVLPGAELAGTLQWLAASLEVPQLIRTIEQGSARISSLVNAVKTYSYMDGAETEEIDLHEGLESTLRVMQSELEGIDVIRRYDCALPRATAHPGELNQVWTHIIDNAADAMGGRGTLTLRTYRDGGDAIIEIQDDGPGIPREIQERIFEPFFTTKDVAPGAGLGLDICYRIVVNRHHGDIRVQSTPGDTRFQVRLPIS